MSVAQNRSEWLAIKENYIQQWTAIANDNDYDIELRQAVAYIGYNFKRFFAPIYTFGYTLQACTTPFRLSSGRVRLEIMPGIYFFV